jgi:hypothetical protein
MKWKVAIGLISYGPQSPYWFLPFGECLANLYKEDIEFDDIFWQGSAAIDLNRNQVVHRWLRDGDSEWLWWIDADNPPQLGAVRRLLELEREMVSGLYYSEFKGGKIKPIAYVKNKHGSYHTIDQVVKWERGEILQVDAVGMGCFLTHRSVYEDIKDNYTVYERDSGGIVCLRDEDIIQGEIPDKFVEHPYAGKVKNGIYYDRLCQQYVTDTKFPFFLSQNTRTEDMPFCELVKELGYEIWVDTSIESGHVKDMVWRGSDYRDQYRPDPAPEERDDVKDS